MNKSNGLVRSCDPGRMMFIDDAMFACLRFFLEIMADTCGRTTANLEISWVIGRTTWRDIFSC